jgi:protein-tyrosine phosphatase
MARPVRLVFVCSGNICRSPMAEALAKRALAEAGLAAMVLSMGTLGIFGQPASENARTVAAEAGLDLTAHASQGLSLGILGAADAVLVMEQAHADQMLAQRPGLRNVWLLSGFESPPGPLDIEDPYGGTIEQYRACFARLERAVAGLVQAVGAGRI